MSRIGSQPIKIPSGTEVRVEGLSVHVKGPKGELSREFRNAINISVEGENVVLTPKKGSDNSVKALWGTYASHITNMIAGVNELFEKKLIIEGVGFKAEVVGKKLVMQLGFSHPVEMDIPEGMDVSVEKEIIAVSGIDKEKVGLFSSQIRLKKKPEPYKGKGIRYEDEVIRRKQGKKAATV